MIIMYWKVPIHPPEISSKKPFFLTCITGRRNKYRNYLRLIRFFFSIKLQDLHPLTLKIDAKKHGSALKERSALSPQVQCTHISQIYLNRPHMS